MIRLKKNDKIIITIAVAIIVVAAIGIALYDAPEDDDNTNLISGEKTFTYSWLKEIGSSISTGYAGKKAAYNDTITISAPRGSVLTNIEIMVNWVDDSTYFGILSRGYDTLTAEIAPMGGVSETQESTGSGNMTFIFNVNSMPEFGTITAESEYDAEEQVKEMFSGENTANLEVTVTVKTGEKIWRPLKYLKDKGNDFELEITYEYYRASLEGSEEQSKETGSDDDGNDPGEPSYLSIIINTGSWKYI